VVDETRRPGFAGGQIDANLASNRAVHLASSVVGTWTKGMPAKTCCDEPAEVTDNTAAQRDDKRPAFETGAARRL